MVGSLIAQPIVEFYPSSSQDVPSVPLKLDKDKKGEHTFSWLTNETHISAIGTKTGSITIAAYMEYTPADLSDIEGYKIDSIKRIHFGLFKDNITKIDSVRVIIAQGTTLASALADPTEIVFQTVLRTSLKAGWNDVLLENTYTIDDTKNLYIGYEATTTSTTDNGGYPIPLASGTNPKQAWYAVNNGTVRNYITTEGKTTVFLIKATGATATLPEVELALTSISFTEYALPQDQVTIHGVVKNTGQDSITSFKCKYEVNGVSSDEEDFTGVDIAPNASYSFSFATPYTATTTGTLPVKATVSMPNGVDDRIENNVKTSSLIVLPYTEFVQRKVLLEGFTSATCGPCVSGNNNLKSVLANVPDSKWTCIKYQMNWPGYGDPYYTAEANVRRNLYEITGVPHLITAGTFGIMTTNYTVADLNAAAAIPSPIKTTGIGVVELSRNEVSFELKITPVTTANLSNLRIFAAVVERRTTGNSLPTYPNGQGNGETEFSYVMKKFLTSASGDSYTNLTHNEEKTFNYRYQFQGNYRLPADARSPINHAIEHSVENFNNLMVIYWVQNMSTKEVLQSGTAECSLGISHVDANIKLNIYPNPATNLINVTTDVAMVKVTLFNLLGQAVKEVNTNHATECQIDVNTLPQGMYLLKVDTKEGSSTQKVQVL